MEMEIASFDPGFGNTKAAYINGKMNTVAVPSVVGIGQTDIGMLDIGAPATPFMRRRMKETPDVTRFDGVSYLVGENVAQFARPVERMDFQRLGDGPELRALFYTTMHRLLGEGSHQDIRLMVGLPVEVMQNKKLALATRRELRRWMIGQHDYSVNDNEASLEVTRLEVLPQPAGSYFTWGMNDEGSWVRGKDNKKQMIAVCDIGFNTLDLFTLRGGSVIARYTGGDNLGMRRAAELLSDHIRQRHQISLSLHGADSLLRQRHPELSTADGLIDLAPLAHQASESVAAGIIQFTERIWGNAKQFRHVLFTGGGAEALRDTLARHYPHGIVLPQAVTANAAGLAKYGQCALS